MKDNIRILIAKVGLDGHDRGALVLTKALREYGMTVIYSGIRKTPEQVCDIALEEEVDIIGLSSLSGGHLFLFSQVMNQLKRRHMDHVPVIVGGLIPQEDFGCLIDIGINKIFLKDETIDEIVNYIREVVEENTSLKQD